MPIENIVRNNLCCGCGTCIAVCPQQAISLKITKGLFVPSVDFLLCRNKSSCNLCYEVCPGRSINIQQYSNDLFQEGTRDKYLGTYLQCYSGYSTDYNIRYHSASGGVVTQLLIYLLKKQIVNGALVTQMSREKPLVPEVKIAYSPKEIIEAQSSKYCPVPLNIAIKEIRARHGKFAVVGLPCHIHGFRKAETYYTELRQKIYLYLGLFCSSNRTFGATEYLLRNFKIPKNDIKSFAYRDEGCLGNMKIKFKDGEIKRFPYVSCYLPLRSFFIPYRCTLCCDHTSELSDISFGDIYIPEFWHDRIGTTSIIARSKRGKEILASVCQEGYVILKGLNKDLIIKSQQESLKRKKNHYFVRCLFNKLLGKKIPIYDLPTEVDGKQIVKYAFSTLILYAEMFIGSNRALWFLIAPLNYIAHVVKKSNPFPRTKAL